MADKLMVAAVLILLCTKPISVGPFAGDHLLVPISALGMPIVLPWTPSSTRLSASINACQLDIYSSVDLTHAASVCHQPSLGGKSP